MGAGHETLFASLRSDRRYYGYTNKFVRTVGLVLAEPAAAGEQNPGCC